MRWAIIFFLLVFCLSVDAQPINKCGQTNTSCWTTANRPTTPGAGTFGYNTTLKVMEFYNGTSWVNPDNGSVNVTDFGATCNTTGDDTTAINNAIAFAHTLTPLTLQPVRIVLPAGGACMLSDSVNMTAWSQLNIQNNGPAVILSGYGAVLQARTGAFVNTHPVLDMMGSFNVQLEGFTVLGSCTAGHLNSTGIQMGRVANGLSAGSHHLLDVKIFGCFTVGGLYNLASEQVLYTNLNVKTFNTTGTPSNTAGPYGVVMDGSYHWSGQIVSPYVAIATTPGQHQSFLSNKFVGGSINNVTAGTAAAMWLSGDLEQLHMAGTYIHAFANGFCIYVQADSTASTQFALWNFEDMHCEPGNPVNIVTRTFYFGGAVAAITMHGFKYKDSANFASSAVFDIDNTSSVTSVAFQNADVQIERYASTGTLFVDTSRFSYSGYYYSSTATQWNPSFDFSGTTCIGSYCTSATRANVPSQAKGMCLFGDSIMFNSDQFVAGPIYRAEVTGGPGSWINYYTQYRTFRSPYTNNFGVSGDTTALMLARVGAVLAANCDMVVMDGGTNDAATGVSCATTVANLNAIFTRLLAARVTIIDTTIFPRSGGAAFTLAQAQAALCVNSWRRSFVQKGSGGGVGLALSSSTAQAGTPTVAPSYSYFLADLDQYMTDLTQTTWTINTGYLQNDGVHPSTRGASAMGVAVAAIINKIVPPGLQPVMTASDVYDGTNNPRGNLLPNGNMLGTAGTIDGCTGQTPTNFTTNSTGTNGWTNNGGTCALSVVTLSNGLRATQAVLGGTLAGTFDHMTLTSTVATPGNVVNGDTVRGVVWVYLATGHSNLAAIQPFITSVVAGVTTLTIGGGSATVYPYPVDGFAGTYGIGGESWIPMMTQALTVTGAPSTLNMQLQFQNNTAAAITATIKTCCWEIRKINP